MNKKAISRRMRQVLKSARSERRELTLKASYPNDAACLDASGAIRLTLHDFLPTLEGGLGLPPGMEVQTGVTGNEVWPVSIDDVTLAEEGEVSALSDQTLGFAQAVTGAPARTGITVELSNMAIDSAGFDLPAYIRTKFGQAQRRYLAAHIYSCAQFEANNGPFSAIRASDWVPITGSVYDTVMTQMTQLEQAGYHTDDACIVLDHDMEAMLKWTPVAYGEGRMVIEDGLCCGYPYVVSKYFNTTLDAQGKLVKNAAKAVGIGFFKFWKVAQHNEARVIIDGVSREVAQRNVTSITINAGWSVTDLSAYLNTGTPAFRMLYADTCYLADHADNILESSEGYQFTV